MGMISRAVDLMTLLFSGLAILLILLLDSQICLSSSLYHPALISFKEWYVDASGDYLIGEKPHFFVGLCWFEIIALLPLCIANVYGILARLPWASSTSFIIGLSYLLYMFAAMAELLGSGRASDRTLQIYYATAAYCVIIILKGLFAWPHGILIRTPQPSSAGKKKV